MPAAARGPGSVGAASPVDRWRRDRRDRAQELEVRRGEEQRLAATRPRRRRSARPGRAAVPRPATRRALGRGRPGVRGHVVDDLRLAGRATAPRMPSVAEAAPDRGSGRRRRPPRPGRVRRWTGAGRSRSPPVGRPPRLRERDPRDRVHLERRRRSRGEVVDQRQLAVALAAPRWQSDRSSPVPRAAAYARTAATAAAARPPSRSPAYPLALDLRPLLALAALPCPIRPRARRTTSPSASRIVTRGVGPREQRGDHRRDMAMANDQSRSSAPSCPSGPGPRARRAAARPGRTASSCSGSRPPPARPRDRPPGPWR